MSISWKNKKLKTNNTLKPTGKYLSHLLNNIYLHFLWFLWFWEQTAIISFNRVNKLIFAMAKYSVSFAVRTEFWIRFSDVVFNNIQMLTCCECNAFPKRRYDLCRFSNGILNIFQIRRLERASRSRRLAFRRRFVTIVALFSRSL